MVEYSSRNQIENIINNGILRDIMVIDGAHDVFTENPETLEKIMIDFCRIKPPAQLKLSPFKQH